jgi:hypothetical protein
MTVVTTFKYKNQISKLPNCPPAGCAGRQVVLFRFVRQDLQHPKNFQPPAIQDPTRIFRGDAACCSSYALSFFETPEAARAKYEGIRRRHPDIHETLGTHLAEVSIQPDDGVLTPARSQHVDLHEYEGVNLVPRAKVVALLFSEVPHGT